LYVQRGLLEWSAAAQGFSVGAQRVVVKQHERHGFDASLGLDEVVHHGFHCHVGGFEQRIAKRARTDGREADNAESARFGHLQAALVAGGEQLIQPARACAPHRADSVNHEFRRQISGARDDGSANLALALRGANAVQVFHDLGAAGAMDGAVHSAAALQRRVGRTHDGVGRDARNVALDGSHTPVTAEHFHTCYRLSRVTSWKLSPHGRRVRSFSSILTERCCAVLDRITGGRWRLPHSLLPDAGFLPQAYLRRE